MEVDDSALKKTRVSIEGDQFFNRGMLREANGSTLGPAWNGRGPGRLTRGGDTRAES